MTAAQNGKMLSLKIVKLATSMIYNMKSLFFLMKILVKMKKKI